MMALKNSKTECNHVWRNTDMPIAKQSKEELFDTVLSCNSSGYWLKSLELNFAIELINEGKVEYCKHCNKRALVLPTKKENKVLF